MVLAKSFDRETQPGVTWISSCLHSSTFHVIFDQDAVVGAPELILNFSGHMDALKIHAFEFH